MLSLWSPKVKRQSEIRKLKQRSTFFKAVSEDCFVTTETSESLSNLREIGFFVRYLRDLLPCSVVGHEQPSTLNDIKSALDVLRDSMKAIDCDVVICLEEEDQSRSFGIFIIGCFMIAVHNQTPDQLWSSIQPCANYNDFRLSCSPVGLLDLWRGFFLGQANGWIEQIRHSPSSQQSSAYSEIIPGELLAYDFDSDEHLVTLQDDNESGCSIAEGLISAGVRTVIRLCELSRNDAELERCGLHVVPLDFDEPVPPAGVVAAFLYTMRTEISGGRGPVAIHCGTGCAGRSGRRLCALYLMRAHDVGARTAAAWVHIAFPPRQAARERPVGYLCAVEMEYRSILAPPVAAPPQQLVDLGHHNPLTELEMYQPAAAASPYLREVGEVSEQRRGSAFHRAVFRAWSTNRARARDAKPPSDPAARRRLRLRPQSAFDGGESGGDSMSSADFDRACAMALADAAALAGFAGGMLRLAVWALSVAVSAASTCGAEEAAGKKVSSAGKTTATGAAEAAGSASAGGGAIAAEGATAAEGAGGPFPAEGVLIYLVPVGACTRRPSVVHSMLRPALVAPA